MTLQEFRLICRNIVSFWPYSTKGRVNCWSTFKGRDELLSSTFGRTYDDYLNGSFWSRSWVKAGSNRNTMEKSYGAILMEHKRGNITDVSRGQIEEHIFITSLQLKEQNGKTLTDDELVDINAEILLGFLSELLEVYQFLVTPVTGDPYKAWLSINQANYIESTPEISSADQMGINIAAFLPGIHDNTPLAQVNFGLEEVRGSAVNFKLRTCDPPMVTLNYNLPQIVSDFIVICQ